MAKEIIHLLDYAATHLQAVIRYTASSMTLYIHSDASYMSEPCTCSRAGGHFFLLSKPKVPTKLPTEHIPLNGPVHSVCEVIRNIMALSSEAEIAVLYTNTKKGEELRMALLEMGHLQPPTPIMTDNSITYGIINNTVKQKCARAIDMHFYWVHDRCTQKYFIVYWAPGKYNLGDYHTKHHPDPHHCRIRSFYLHVNRPVAYTTVIQRPSGLQGCVESAGTQTTCTQDLDDIMAILCQNRMTSQRKLVKSDQRATPAPMITAMPKIFVVRIQ
eukprot:6516976-Ditylum_brightwellii.AAC.1